MVYGILASLGFCVCLSMFGWAVARRTFRLTHTIDCLAMALAGSVATYLVLVNALGYLLPIQLSFVTSVFILFIVACLLIFCVSKPGIKEEKLPRSIVFLLLLLTGAGGFAVARVISSDPWAWGYLPLARSMLEGNFPVHEVTNPTAVMGYHYGPMLLAAAWMKLTGFSLAAGFNVQPFWGIATGLACCMALIRHMKGSWLAAAIGSTLALAASGFLWIYAIPLAHDLFDFFILKNHNIAPFRFLVPMYGTNIGPSLFIMFGSRTYTLGFPFLYALLFSLHQLLQPQKKMLTFLWAVACIVFGLALAHSMETSLLLLLPAAGAYIVITAMSSGKIKSVVSWQRQGMLLLLLFIPLLFLAVKQGGILTAALQQTELKPEAFTIGFNGMIQYSYEGNSVGFWQWLFIRDIGLPFLLLPFVLLYTWRRRDKNSFALLLCLLALAQIAVPFFFHYKLRPHETLRFMYVGFSLISLLAGVMFAETWLVAKKRWKRWSVHALIIAMLLSSTVCLLTKAFFPTMRFERAPLFGQMPPASPEEQRMYEWVLNHTTMQDYFYSSTINVNTMTLPDEVTQQRDRIRFITYTGRFNVGYLLWGTQTPLLLASQKEIESNCRPTAFNRLSIRYLIVSQQRSAWFSSACNPADWHLRYKDPQSDYPQIYELQTKE